MGFHGIATRDLFTSLSERAMPSGTGLTIRRCEWLMTDLAQHQRVLVGRNDGGT